MDWANSAASLSARLTAVERSREDRDELRTVGKTPRREINTKTKIPMAKATSQSEKPPEAKPVQRCRRGRRMRGSKYNLNLFQYFNLRNPNSRIYATPSGTAYRREAADLKNEVYKLDPANRNPEPPYFIGGLMSFYTKG